MKRIKISEIYYLFVTFSQSTKSYQHSTKFSKSDFCLQKSTFILHFALCILHFVLCIFSRHIALHKPHAEVLVGVDTEVVERLDRASVDGLDLTEDDVHILRR